MSTSPPLTPSLSAATLSQHASTNRLQSLYSDFSRQKQSNPVAFRANVEYWKQNLTTIVREGLLKDGLSTSRLTLSVNSSLMNFLKHPKVGKPLALGAVLAELHDSNTFVPIVDFMGRTTSLYATRSLPVRVVSYVVGKPLWWALEQAGIVGEEGMFGSGTRNRNQGTSWYGGYVLVPLVETAGDAVIEMQAGRSGSPADALYSWRAFGKVFVDAVKRNSEHPQEFQEESLDTDDQKVLLKYLERDRGVLVYDREIIKFIDPNAPAEARTITGVDRGVFQLKNAVASLHGQIELWQAKIDQCTQDASKALQQGRKPIALGRIRLRKQYQDILSKRLNSLSTLESTLASVEAAMGDVEIMKSYELSTATLKSILSHPSLERGNIDKTMEALAEANADAREIDDAVRIAGDVAVGVSENIDDSEVEAEWEALVKEMAATRKQGTLDAEVQRKLVQAKVPAHVPSVEKEKDRERLPMAA
ncbi:hypothetical protein BKA70DRAFT_1247141 [Coprinopsis sp. MPI-PUGE-AT-0042]|nr:hypothetical protein BKA70DRAFT_1247141 [Coprinopsis sp. MPI-PUGE-AT-0042]